MIDLKKMADDCVYRPLDQCSGCLEAFARQVAAAVLLESERLIETRRTPICSCKACDENKEICLLLGSLKRELCKEESK